jgi:hypothetical protein
MNTLRDNTKLTPELQFNLGQYKILRDTAKKETAKLKGPKYFGMNETADAFNIYVADDTSKLDSVDDPMQLAIVAPDNEEFDILAPKEYSKKFDVSTEKGLRVYLRKLIDSI